MNNAASPFRSRLGSILPAYFPFLGAGSRARQAIQPMTGIVVLAWTVRVVSLINILNAILRYQPKFIYWLGKWVPFEISEDYRIRMFLLSILLFVLASGLERGKRVAWQITIGGLMLAPILHLGRAAVWPQALINLALIGFLLWHHRYFVARSDQKSVRTAVIIYPLLVLALVVFGTVRLHALHKETAGNHSWLACLQSAGELVLVHRSETQEALMDQTRDLFKVLSTGGTLTALAGLVLVLRPVLLRRKAPLEQRNRIRHLIDSYGNDPFNPYALIDDKSYFFTANGGAVVPYVLSSNIAVALADPIGAPQARAEAIAEFSFFCRSQDWEPVFYAITEEMHPFYERMELSIFKIGEEAHLQADTFALKGGAFQNLRTVCNQARKHGIRFRWYDAATGLDENLERGLAHISRQWLDMKKAREMTFDMGSYSLEDIRRDGAGVAVDPAGQPLAFATWRPYQQGAGRSLDLMRALPQARNVMDFVLVESIFSFRARRIRQINLGMAPLAEMKPAASALVAEERVVRLLYENLNHIYGYKSLFEFKRKYRPQWRGRYVAYRRGVKLPLVGLALARVHAPEGIWKFLIG